MREEITIPNHHVATLYIVLLRSCHGQKGEFTVIAALLEVAYNARENMVVTHNDARKLLGMRATRDRNDYETAAFNYLEEQLSPAVSLTRSEASDLLGVLHLIEKSGLNLGMDFHAATYLISKLRAALHPR
jgi:hypothetical protein